MMMNNSWNACRFLFFPHILPKPDILSEAGNPPSKDQSTPTANHDDAGADCGQVGGVVCPEVIIHTQVPVPF